MQRILERVKKSERALAKKKAKAYEQRLRSEAWQRNQERIRTIKENTALVREDRRNRAIDWDAGRLAPRRDVGDQAKTYGAVSAYHFQLPEKDPKSRLESTEWNIYKGDRVVITRGRDKGKIGEITDIDRMKDAVKVEGLNMIDVAPPDWLKKQQDDKRDVVPVDQFISRKDVKLVFPLPDPVTGIFRDTVIERMELVEKKGLTYRVISGTNTVIPRPRFSPAKKQSDTFNGDSRRITVDERTFQPFLIRPPMPLTVIDEMRNKYSRFRTRHEHDYKVRKELEDAKVEGRKGLIKTMRTPLQELASLREKQKAEQERELSSQQLAKIGEIIAQEQGRTQETADMAAARG